MRIVHTVADLRAAMAECRQRGTVGLVPTMGNLHAGHLSLIRAARECDAVALSLFVNPTQFGPGEDYQSYPRTFDDDCQACRRRGVDVLFAPPPEEMYPEPPATTIHLAGPTDRLCGASRPGHFDGVCTVVCKLLNLFQPDRAYFGAKDFQQSVVVRRMVRDLNLPVEIVVCPTVRHVDGLAMSSRNAYLSPTHRREAVALSAALAAAAKRIREKAPPAAVLREQIVKQLGRQAPAGEIDYVEIVDPDSLKPVDQTTDAVLVAVAVRFGSARLIDNVLVGQKLPLRQGPR